MEIDPHRPPTGRSLDATPVVVIGFVVALLVAGFYLFPAIKAIVQYQDCVASGRTSCDRD